MKHKKTNLLLMLGLGVALIFAFSTGVDAKKKSKIKVDKAKKIYNIELTCDSSNPEAGVDAVIATNQEDYDDKSYALYKKFRISDIKKAKMPNMSLYKKESFYSGLNGDVLKLVSTQTQYFFTDGYLWLRSGSKGEDLGREIVECSGNVGNYVLFVY